MKTLTEKELVELDAWIDLNVLNNQKHFGVKKRGYWYRPNACGYTDRESEAWHMTQEQAKEHESTRGDEPVTVHRFQIPRYSIDSASAMIVLEACLNKNYQGEIIKSAKYGFRVRYTSSMMTIEMGEWCQSLPLAICMSAKALFITLPA
jgi:hypothetical protein